MAYPTNPIYKEVKDLDGKVNGVITPGLIIPAEDIENNVVGNCDWEDYIKWKNAGNTPEAAD